MKKILLTIIITLVTISCAIPSFASSIELTPQTQETIEIKEEAKLAANDGTISGLLNAGKDFISEGESQQKDQNGNPTTIDTQMLGQTAGFMYKIILGIGTLLATIVGIVIGIQFMMASSADEKAKWKETLKVYVVGIIIVYGALGIWFMMSNILNNIT